MTHVDDLERRREPAPARYGMPLSAREEETLRLLSCGHNYERIAELMDISVDTVKSHLKRVFIKLGARNGVHAVAMAYETKVFLAQDRTPEGACSVSAVSE